MQLQEILATGGKESGGTGSHAPQAILQVWQLTEQGNQLESETERPDKIGRAKRAPQDVICVPLKKDVDSWGVMMGG